MVVQLKLDWKMLEFSIICDLFSWKEPKDLTNSFEAKLNVFLCFSFHPLT